MKQGIGSWDVPVLLWRCERPPRLKGCVRWRFIQVSAIEICEFTMAVLWELKVSSWRRQVFDERTMFWNCIELAACKNDSQVPSKKHDAIIRFDRETKKAPSQKTWRGLCRFTSCSLKWWYRKNNQFASAFLQKPQDKPVDKTIRVWGRTTPNFKAGGVVVGSLSWATLRSASDQATAGLRGTSSGEVMRGWG